MIIGIGGTPFVAASEMIISLTSVVDNRYNISALNGQPRTFGLRLEYIAKWRRNIVLYGHTFLNWHDTCPTEHATVVLIRFSFFFLVPSSSPSQYKFVVALLMGQRFYCLPRGSSLNINRDTLRFPCLSLPAWAFIGVGKQIENCVGGGSLKINISFNCKWPWPGAVRCHLGRDSSRN